MTHVGAKTGDNAANSAFDTTASEMVHVGPVAFLHTIKAIASAAHDGTDKLAMAIARQEWAGIVSPVKFFTAVVAIITLGTWAITGRADEGPKITTSLNVPGAAIGGAIAALALHYALSRGRYSQGLVTGALDGATKIFQVGIYLIMPVMPLWYLAEVLNPDDTHFTAPLWKNLSGVLLLVCGAFVLLASVFVVGPAIVSRIYGVSRIRVIFWIIVLDLTYLYLDNAYQTGSAIGPLLQFVA